MPSSSVACGSERRSSDSEQESSGGSLSDAKLEAEFVENIYEVLFVPDDDESTVEMT